MEVDTVSKLKVLEFLRSKANEFIDLMDRDKRILAYRYVIQCKSLPDSIAQMGFLQYVEKEIDTLDLK